MPDLGGLLDDGPGRLLALVPLAADRSDHVLGELVDPVLERDLVLVQLEREVGMVPPGGPVLRVTSGARAVGI